MPEDWGDFLISIEHGHEIRIQDIETIRVVQM
jgi:hypothetical protein